MSPIDPPPPNQPPPPPPGGYGSEPPYGGYGSQPPGGHGAQPPGGDADPGAAFSWAWKKFTANAATLIVAFLVIVVAIAITGLILGSIVGGLLYASGSSAFVVSDSTSAGSLFLGTLLITLPTVTVGYLLGSGYAKALLSIADGQKPSIGEALTPHNPPKTVVYALIVGAISAALAAIGSLIPVLGGLLSNGASLVVGFLLSFGLFFLVDKNLEPVEAIKASIDLVTKNLGPALIFYLMVIAAAFVGFLACCIGIVVGAPVGGLIYTYGYRRLSGGNITA